MKNVRNKDYVISFETIFGVLDSRVEFLIPEIREGLYIEVYDILKYFSQN
jgi:hypothetical protein